jgi:predicted ester cyclase
MSLEENKAVARRYFEDAPFNPAACDEIFAPSFQFHAIVHTGVTPQTVESNPQSEQAAYEQHQAIWGGWHFQIEEMIAEGDRVMVRWTSHGTQQGEFNGLPPTGTHTTNSGINIFRIADGRIAEVWDIYDRLWMWQQLDVLPEIKEALAKRRAELLAQQGQPTA